MKTKCNAKAQVGKTPFFGLMNVWACQPGAIFKEILDKTILEMDVEELIRFKKSKAESAEYQANAGKKLD